MGQFNVPPGLAETLRDIKARLAALETNQTVTAPSTVSTTPGGGTIRFVAGGGAGSQFQGWNGTTWVPLG